MIRLLGLSGSLRQGSFNTALLNAAATLVDDVSVEVVRLHDIPLYDGDLEARIGLPIGVNELMRRMHACDGVLIATPEYNTGIPGVLKNTLDWLSRPSTDHAPVFPGRPVAVMGATPGGLGTALAQSSLLPVLRALGTRTWFGPRMMVSKVDQAFDAEGLLVDERLREQLATFLQGYAAFIRDRAGA